MIRCFAKQNSRFLATLSQRLLLALLFCLSISGCRHSEKVEAASSPSLAKKASAARWLKTELYFGLAIPKGGQVSAAEWEAFLDQEITPRFPNGLTVVDTHGQWLGHDGKFVKEPGKLLTLIYEDQPEHKRAIDEIRAAYKKRFEQEAVLKATQRVEVEF